MRAQLGRISPLSKINTGTIRLLNLIDKSILVFPFVLSVCVVNDNALILNTKDKDKDLTPVLNAL